MPVGTKPYLIREFERHVQDFVALDDVGAYAVGKDQQIPGALRPLLRDAPLWVYE